MTCFVLDVLEFLCNMVDFFFFHILVGILCDS